jgi:tetratricopeptide (TPR) repeat protein
VFSNSFSCDCGVGSGPSPCKCLSAADADKLRSKAPINPQEAAEAHAAAIEHLRRGEEMVAKKDFGAAESRMQLAVALFGRVGDLRARNAAMLPLAELYMALESFDKAEELLEHVQQSWLQRREDAVLRGQALRAMHILTVLLLQSERYEEATQAGEASLDGYMQLDRPAQVFAVLLLLVQAHVLRESFDEATATLGSAEQLLPALGAPEQLRFQEHKALVSQAASTVRASPALVLVAEARQFFRSGQLPGVLQCLVKALTCYISEVEADHVCTSVADLALLAGGVPTALNLVCHLRQAEHVPARAAIYLGWLYGTLLLLLFVHRQLPHELGPLPAAGLQKELLEQLTAAGVKAFPKRDSPPNPSQTKQDAFTGLKELGQALPPVGVDGAHWLERPAPELLEESRRVLHSTVARLQQTKPRSSGEWRLGLLEAGSWNQIWRLAHQSLTSALWLGGAARLQRPFHALQIADNSGSWPVFAQLGRRPASALPSIDCEAAAIMERVCRLLAAAGSQLLLAYSLSPLVPLPRELAQRFPGAATQLPQLFCWVFEHNPAEKTLHVKTERIAVRDGAISQLLNALANNVKGGLPAPASTSQDAPVDKNLDSLLYEVSRALLPDDFRERLATNREARRAVVIAQCALLGLPFMALTLPEATGRPGQPLASKVAVTMV